MKFFSMICGAVLVLSAVPALAQLTPGQEGSGGSAVDSRGPGGPATMLDVKSTGPGQAVLEFSSLNVNFLDGVPDKMRAFWTDTDMSGQGTANIVAIAGHEGAFKGAKFCIRGVGVDWEQVICSSAPVSATGSISLTVPASGKATFAVVPTIEGRGAPLWVTHPDNARYMLACSRGSVMATMLTVNAGVISIASEADVTQYQQNPKKFWCPRG